MTHAEVIAQIRESRMIAILRGDFRGKEVDIASSLEEGGISALEVSIVSPDYGRTIRSLAAEFGNRIAVGAGTVLTEEQVRQVADCGASFIVSPNCDPIVIGATRQLGLASFPGAYTPTEIVLANGYEADAIKVFPAVSLGPRYIAALRGPFPHMRLVPTGGVTVQNISAYLAAGAWAVGVGSELVHARDSEKLDTAVLAEKGAQVCSGITPGPQCLIRGPRSSVWTWVLHEPGWLTEGDTVHAYRMAEFGARDTALHRDRLWLSGMLCGLMDETFQRAATGIRYPRYAVAAGMITSAQGMLEIPHVEAPASSKDIVAGMRTVDLMHRTDASLILILIPGVRTGSHRVTPGDISTTDLMRGEETLCIGLLETGALKNNMSVLNLGSHWKWIFVDRDGRISGSRTTLIGEMIHAVQANTLLAASLSDGKPNTFDIEWVQSGLREAKAEGLGRALFCVRLLDHQGHGTAEQRLSFLYGASLAEEIESAKKRLRQRGGQVLISGSPALAAVRRECLQGASISAAVIEEGSRETAYLKGLSLLAKKSGLLI